MKKLVFIMLFTMFIAFTTLANATLWDRGGGMIYDDVLDITWLQDANYAKTSGYDADGLMTWDNAMIWADQLVYGGYDDWRLPDTNPLNGVSYQVTTTYNWVNDGSRERGFNVSAPGTVYTGSTSSEMAYMFYNNLGNVADYSPDLVWQPNHGLSNVGSFLNLQNDCYWSETTDGVLYPDHAWEFIMRTGSQDFGGKWEAHGYAWAVRDGDVLDTRTVPEPATILLLGLGLMGLVGLRKKLERKK